MCLIRRRRKMVFLLSVLCILGVWAVIAFFRPESDEQKYRRLLRWQVQKDRLDSFRRRHPLPRIIDKQIYEYERRLRDRSNVQIKAFLASGYFTNLSLMATNGHPNL